MGPRGLNPEHRYRGGQHGALRPEPGRQGLIWLIDQRFFTHLAPGPKGTTVRGKDSAPAAYGEDTMGQIRFYRHSLYISTFGQHGLCL